MSVTHDQAEALAIGSRVAVMDAGRLMQVGTPHELYERPADVFVAGFVGSPAMNLLEMRLAREDGRATLRRGPLTFTPPAEVGLANRSAITLGFRPQDVRLAPAASAAEVGLRGRCELVEYLGSAAARPCRLGGDEILVMGDPSAGIRPGDVVDCSLPYDRLHLFDTETGLALRPLRGRPVEHGGDGRRSLEADLDRSGGVALDAGDTRGGRHDGRVPPLKPEVAKNDGATHDAQDGGPG